MVDAAIPDMAVATVVRPFEQMITIKRLYIKVLPVPPGPSTKKTLRL
jgi:hypothetical protein